MILSSPPGTWAALQVLAALLAMLVLVLRTGGASIGLRWPFAWALLAAAPGAVILDLALRLARWALAGARGAPAVAVGASSFGALLAVVVVFAALARARGFAPRKALDLAAPPLAALLAVGRIGCLLVGCEHGAPTPVPWAVAYQQGPVLIDHARRGLVAVDAAASLPVHPVAAYEVVVAFVAGGVALIASWRRRRDGDAFLLGAAVFAVGRASVEILRERVTPGETSRLNTGQVLAIFCLIAVIRAWRWSPAICQRVPGPTPPDGSVAPGPRCPPARG